MLHRGELDIIRIKPFCSEKFLINFIELIRKNEITSYEIKVVNEILKEELLPYYIIKYPNSEEKEISLTFSKEINERDNF